MVPVCFLKHPCKQFNSPLNISSPTLEMLYFFLVIQYHLYDQCYFLPFINLLHLSVYSFLRRAINYAPKFFELFVEVLVHDEPYIEQSQLCKKFLFCQPLRPPRKVFANLKKVTRSAKFCQSRAVIMMTLGTAISTKCFYILHNAISSII